MSTRSTAIVGGGISGLAAAYELARSGRSFTLFEASGRLGGTVETVRAQGFVIECGPDSWVTEKPWARELAVELGLEDKIVPSNDRWRSIYLARDSRLAPFPDGMRMMVPLKWGPLLKSPLLSRRARLEYLREPGRARKLKASAPRQDESVAEFVRRHFGEEATLTLAGPLLAGVFGGDIHALSVRAVMPSFVRMEAEHGSLITALRLQEKIRSRSSGAPQAIFSTLANGLEELIGGMAAGLPENSVKLRRGVLGIQCACSAEKGTDAPCWCVRTEQGEHRFDSLILATPAHVTRELLRALGAGGPRMAGLLPSHASSAIVVALAFNPSQSGRMRIPRGFGFLAPSSNAEGGKPISGDEHALLACTFADQKFADRAPPGSRLLRAFFGGASSEALLEETDDALVERARREIAHFLQPQSGLGHDESILPEPVLAVVRRWPRSLPQYTVGHLDRIAELEALADEWPGLRLVGNAFHGVGLPDLIRDGRAAARRGNIVSDKTN